MEQLLRLGVALLGGGFCCMVNVPTMLAKSPGAATGAGVWPDAGGAALWLSLAQDGGPGGSMAAAGTSN